MLIFRRITNAFRRSKLEKDIDRELRSHVELHIADNIAVGMSPEGARRDALIRFGNRTLTRERVTAVDAELAFDAFWRELRYAARQLRRSPTFTLTALVTLILGIGANVVVFGVLNAVVLRPLDVPQPAGLYNIVHKQQGYDNQSYPDYRDFQSKNSTFSDMAAYRIEMAGLSTKDAAYKCWYDRVSGNYFDMLGAQPAQGRFFHPSDEHGPNSAPYIVLSYSFWRWHFNSDPRVIGTTVDLNKHPFTVIGVAPAEFHGTDLFIWPDFWMPIVNTPDYEGTDFLSWRGQHNLWILGKLKPGVTAQQATDNLDAIGHELARQNPDDDGLDARLVKPGLMGDMFGGPARSFLTGIMFLAFLVLLAACANLASLFAARTADRSRELAIRLAIGSSRWNVLRQLLAEAVLVSVLGGGLGTLFSTVLLNALTRWQPFPEFPIHVTVAPDPKVYLAALILSIGSGILWGLIPARQIWATDSAQVMKSGGASTLVFRRFTLRDLLLGGQITLCTLLVTSSFVALRGMQRSLHAPLGFQPQDVVLAETDLHMGGHFGVSVMQIRKRMIEEVGRIPGVTSVGIIDETPLGTGGSSSTVYREGTTDFRPSNSAFGAKFFGISPGYLDAAGTRLLSGRDFTWHDDAKAPRVAIVNAKFAHSMFGTADAVGRRFLWGDKTHFEIVGIVENGKYDSLTETPWAAMFLPLEQNPNSDNSLMVRSPLPLGEIIPEVRRTLTQIDPSQPFVFHTWSDALAFVQFPARAATASLGVMGLLAAMLAVTGVFGMAMYSVSKRMREFGIRVAVGAQPVQLMRSALSRPLILLLSGSAAGLLLGLIASRLLAQIVYQATPRDPLVLAGVIITMAVLGLLATWLPARRALQIHPASLLREE
ncbi:MAG TPA: ABC transporter permease [Candidatus Acidoferrum sp.]|nr:ABC transporter permease [Candidatus Acidoferrum sp.]